MSRLRVAILTPDPADRDFGSRWRSVLERLRAPLEAAAIRVDALSWAEPAALDPFDLVMPLLVWGYHRDLEAWRNRIGQWRKRDVKVRNPLSTLEWNSDKSYLDRLAGRGAPVVPTLFVEQIDEAQLERAVGMFATEQLIAKPRISASAWRTIRWSPGMCLRDGPEGPALIQPFLPSIQEEGEISLIYFGGRFSHAIRKRPQPGEFRVQPEYNGIITRYSPQDDELEAAERILSQLDEPLLYARVDLVRAPSGAPLLMELELVEPDLYLEHDPAHGSAFAAAVRQAAHRS